jgi:hypothetical protein
VPKVTASKGDKKRTTVSRFYMQNFRSYNTLSASENKKKRNKAWLRRTISLGLSPTDLITGEMAEIS